MNTLFAEFREVMRAGDEEKARAFLVDHFAEFSPEVQEELAMLFYEEGMTNKLEAEKNALALKEGIVELFKDPDPQAAA